MATAALCENKTKAKIVAVCMPSTSNLYHSEVYSFCFSSWPVLHTYMHTYFIDFPQGGFSRIIFLFTIKNKND